MKLSEYLKEDATNPIKFNYRKVKVDPIQCPGFVLPDRTIGELFFDPITGGRGFIVAIPGQDVEYVDDFVTPDGRLLVPLKGKLVGQTILFPIQSEEYGTTIKLYKSIKSYIHKYVDIPDIFESIASIYVLLSWVHDSLPSLPYLRLRGDYGTGKTRFLKTVGSICFRPIMASGATTASPIFRILEKCPGTFVLDEADWRYSGSWTEIVKILNNGYEQGLVVLRSESLGNNKWEPKSYRVFGPKIMASREQFEDEALESRCLTNIMRSSSRDDIPFNLPTSFDEEALDLRNKLVTYRFNNLFAVKRNVQMDKIIDASIRPRLNQILMSMVAVVDEEPLLVKLIHDYAFQLNEDILTQLSNTLEAAVLEAIVELHSEGKKLSMKDIADKASRTPENGVEARKVSEIVRKRFNLSTERDNDTNRTVVIWVEEAIKSLGKRYGIEV